MKEIFDSIAGLSGTSISYSEFIQAAMDKETQLSEENLDRAFDAIAAGEEKISLVKLQEALVSDQDSDDGSLI